MQKRISLNLLLIVVSLALVFLTLNVYALEVQRWARGGMTPYRSDVKLEEVPFLTYDAIRQKVGEKNVLLMKYDEKMVDDMKSFTDQWRAAYRFAKP